MHFHNVSRHMCGRCLTKHIADKGVTWRRVALTKKRWKKLKIGGGEEKLLENWKKRKKGRREKGEKRKNWGKTGKQEGKWRTKVEGREQERREGWEAQRAEGLLDDTANVVGNLPAISRPPLHGKRPCSNLASEKTKNAGKIEKMHIWAERTLVRSPRQCNFWHQAQRNDLGQTALVQEWPNNFEKTTENATKLTAHSSHHCPKSSKMLQKHCENDKLMSPICKNPIKTWQKQQFAVRNWPTEGPMFQKSFSKEGFRVHLIRTLSFFPRKKW